MRKTKRMLERDMVLARVVQAALRVSQPNRFHEVGEIYRGHSPDWYYFGFKTKWVSDPQRFDVTYEVDRLRRVLLQNPPEDIPLMVLSLRDARYADDQLLGFALQECLNRGVV